MNDFDLSFSSIRRRFPPSGCRPRRSSGAPDRRLRRCASGSSRGGGGAGGGGREPRSPRRQGHQHRHQPLWRLVRALVAPGRRQRGRDSRRGGAAGQRAGGRGGVRRPSRREAVGGGPCGVGQRHPQSAGGHPAPCARARRPHHRRCGGLAGWARFLCRRPARRCRRGRAAEGAGRAGRHFRRRRQQARLGRDRSYRTRRRPPRCRSSIRSDCGWISVAAHCRVRRRRWSSGRLPPPSIASRQREWSASSTGMARPPAAARDGLEALGLAPWARAEDASNLVTAFAVPEGIDALRLLETLRAADPDFSFGVGPGAERLIRLNHTGRRADPGCGSRDDLDPRRRPPPLTSCPRLPKHPASKRCSSMVEQQPSKLNTRVRFPSPAPAFPYITMV